MANKSSIQLSNWVLWDWKSCPSGGLQKLSFHSIDSPSNQLDPNTLWKGTESRKNNKESETVNIFFHKRGGLPAHMGLFVSFWRKREPIHVQISLVTTRNELIRLLVVVSAQSNKGDIWYATNAVSVIVYVNRAIYTRKNKTRLVLNKTRTVPFIRACLI